MYPVDTLSFCMRVTLRLVLKICWSIPILYELQFFGGQKFHECPLMGETYTRNVKKDILIFNKKKDVFI